MGSVDALKAIRWCESKEEAELLLSLLGYCLHRGHAFTPSVGGSRGMLVLSLTNIGVEWWNRRVNWFEFRSYQELNERFEDIING